MASDITNAFMPEQIAKMLEGFHIPGLDVSALMQAQRKNMEALTQASQVFAAGASDIAKKQAEIVKMAMQEATAHAASLKAGDVAASAAAQQDFIKKAFETGLANARELGEMVTRSNTEAYQLIEQRVKESVKELRAAPKGT